MNLRGRTPMKPGWGRKPSVGEKLPASPRSTPTTRSEAAQ